MNLDPIVQEIRENRAQLFEECDCDPVKLLDRLQEMEGQDARPRVTLEEFRARYGSKTPATTEKSGDS